MVKKSMNSSRQKKSRCSVSDRTFPLLPLLAFLALAFSPLPSQAEVVRPAPNFSWLTASASPASDKDFRGRPVVLLIAPSPSTWAFRRQIHQLQDVYQRLSATKAVCVVALTAKPGTIRSDIPFTIAQDGPSIAALYGIKKGFAIALIGKDGNLDAISSSVLAGQRVLDIIANSFVSQETLRRD